MIKWRRGKWRVGGRERSAYRILVVDASRNKGMGRTKFRRENVKQILKRYWWKGVDLFNAVQGSNKWRIVVNAVEWFLLERYSCFYVRPRVVGSRVIHRGSDKKYWFLLYNQKGAPVSQIIYSCKTLYMFRAVFPSIMRSSRLHIQQQAYVKQLLLPAASVPTLAASGWLYYRNILWCTDLWTSDFV